MTDPEKWIDAAGNHRIGDRIELGYAADLGGYAVPIPLREWTRLESGQLISHHSSQECEGNCCLHGTSPHPQCRQRRHWHQEKRFLMHECACGEFHPCEAGVDYAVNSGWAVPSHVCCGIRDHCGVAETPVGEPEAVESLKAEVKELRATVNGLMAQVANHREHLKGISVCKTSRRLSKLETLAEMTTTTIGIQNDTTETLTRAVRRLRGEQRFTWWMALFGAAMGGGVLLSGIAAVIDHFW